MAFSSSSSPSSSIRFFLFAASLHRNFLPALFNRLIGTRLYDRRLLGGHAYAVFVAVRARVCVCHLNLWNNRKISYNIQVRAFFSNISLLFFSSEFCFFFTFLLSIFTRWHARDEKMLQMKVENQKPKNKKINKKKTKHNLRPPTVQYSQSFTFGK